MVEHRTENSGVRGSIPFIGMIKLYYLFYYTTISYKVPLKKKKMLLCFYLWYFFNYNKYYYQVKIISKSLKFNSYNKFLLFNVPQIGENINNSLF